MKDSETMVLCIRDDLMCAIDERCIPSLAKLELSAAFHCCYVTILRSYSEYATRTFRGAGRTFATDPEFKSFTCHWCFFRLIRCQRSRPTVGSAVEFITYTDITSVISRLVEQHHLYAGDEQAYDERLKYIM